MANSKYEYVRSFEQPDSLLANTWIVIRIDGRGFTKFTARYNFTKPNDRRALDLMNAAAEAVMKELPDLCLAYGNSDEYSFVFHKDCVLFERRASKLTTTIVSTFSAYYIYLWPNYFEEPLTPPLPSFDGRAVCYPSDRNLRDYMSWRQVDCHINNLYNTTFWALVKRGGLDPRAAEQELSGTVSSDKNEILFSRFGINYNNEPEIFKKGSVMYRDFFPPSAEPSPLPQTVAQSTPPLSHPRPQRAIVRPLSQPAAPSYMDPARISRSSSDGNPRGPTFLSSTPSPPPSPPLMSTARPQYPQTFIPVSPPPNGTSTMSHNHKLPILTPIPLPPPTLKPSTKPPPSLTPPDPTAHINTSPQPSPIPSGTFPSRTKSNPAQPQSHSASTSLPTTAQPPPPPTTAPGPSSSRPKLKHRSPSLSILESQPPIIPLRMSSIPANNKPRKLSIQSQRSLGMLNKEDSYNEGPPMPSKGSRHSPPLTTMKELPSPPPRERREREDQAPVRTEPDVSPSLARFEGKGEGTRPRTPPRHPSRGVSSAAATASLDTTPSTASSTFILPKGKQAKSKPAKGPKRNLNSESGGWAAGTQSQEEDTGRPKEWSRTQREKDRKKRTKARIVIEHVDIIRDEFWERRPWILSGRAGM
ncbi:Thg1-domain-containing protein [Westerdykella ornata]|uniref:tRNA(His) guanylyltransferase n=1 Tax=Westerdykella ornata TaxID=318751 RepID=A0A6A6JQ65_WESOR|nr:Thg1-domain-containing protein [Westerdykella ornata]KAF2277826.1 Thg1-domain-containing protein [Westerdykella ornata]